MINTAAEWPLADIPNLPATKITSGSLDVARIPNLDAAKITTGTISGARLPSTTFECLMFKAVGARDGGSPSQKTIGTSLALLDSHITIGDGVGEIGGGEHWQASVLFVHRSS